MRSLLAAFFLSCITLYASILPILHLDSPTLKAFEDYVVNFEKTVPVQFAATGKLWIDDPCCSKNGVFDASKPVVEARENQDVANGSIHHFSGAVHVKGGTVESIRHLMEDYPNYVRYFKPDVGQASGTRESDSTPRDEHYKAHLRLVQTTLFMDVTYDTLYDTHYLRLDSTRWMSRSTASSIKEWREPKDQNAGFYPEGNDHGFLWRTNTYWFARERNGGLDLAAESIALSRPNVSGFAWFGSKRSRDAVEKMLRDAKASIEAMH